MTNNTKLKLTTTRNVEGKNKTFVRTYQNISTQASKENLLKISTAISGLIEDTVVTVSRVDEVVLQ